MSRNPHVAMLLDRVKAMAPLIRLEAEASNEERQLSEPLVEALHDIGIMRMYVPQSYGGLGLTPVEIMPVAEALARIDASVGWSAVVGAGSLAFATLMKDAAARAEIMGGPRGSAAGSGSPQSYRLQRVDGGYRVSGRSSFATSSTFATWMTVGGAVFDSEQPVTTPNGPELVFGMIPATDFRVVDTWNATALRGTGSHDVEVDDAFIPDSRTFNLFDISPRPDDPYYCVPLLHRCACNLVAIGIGAAQHAIDAFIELAETKIAGGDFVPLRDRSIARIELARAMALVNGARAYVTDTAQRLHDLAYGGRQVLVEEMANLRLALVSAAASAAEAADHIRTIAGTSGMSPSCAIERCWRDAHGVASHAGFGVHNLEKVGMVALGIDPPGGI